MTFIFFGTDPFRPILGENTKEVTLLAPKLMPAKKEPWIIPISQKCYPPTKIKPSQKNKPKQPQTSDTFLLSVILSTFYPPLTKNNKNKKRRPQPKKKTLSTPNQKEDPQTAASVDVFDLSIESQREVNELIFEAAVQNSQEAVFGFGERRGRGMGRCDWVAAVFFW